MAAVEPLAPTADVEADDMAASEPLARHATETLLQEEERAKRKRKKKNALADIDQPKRSRKAEKTLGESDRRKRLRSQSRARHSRAVESDMNSAGSSASGSREAREAAAAAAVASAARRKSRRTINCIDSTAGGRRKGNGQVSEAADVSIGTKRNG